MNQTCLSITPEIQKLTDEIVKLYPVASQIEGVTPTKVAEWVGQYNTEQNKQPDFIPVAKTLAAAVEEWRNKDGKSFFNTSASRAIITPQLIDHLKANGYNIKSKADMERFFKENPNSSIQQAIEENQEMHDIRAKAIADGTFMKAPNGRDTNLTERQWLQVRTKNFINWFGDWLNDTANASKVVDENGEPLVVYHNSKGYPLTSYDIGRVGENGGQMFGAGIYASTNKKYNSIFGDIENALFISIKNPLKLSSRGNTSEGRDFMNAVAFDRFKDGKQTNVPDYFKEKYDGVIGTNLSENATIEYVAWNPNQIKSATGNNSMFSTENDDIQMAISRRKTSINSSLSPQEKSNIRTLLKTINRTGTTLLDNGESTMYLLDHTDREGIENRNPKKEDGFNCRLKFSTDGYTNKEIETIKNEIKNGNIQNQKDFNRWVANYSKGQGSNNSDSIDVEDRRTNANNVGLDSEAQQRESRRRQNNQNSQEDFGTSFIRVYDNDGTNGPRYIPINANEILELYATPQGEVYGFVAPNDDIYLDETVISPEHPIHEFTHLWDRVIAQRDPRLWNRGIELMKDPNLKLPGHDKTIWQEVEEDANYGQRWQKFKESNPSKYESLIASEVHAKITGIKGLRLLDEIAQQKGAKGIVAKLKEWMLDVWKNLKATFSDWSDEDIQKLTLKDFVQMTLRDFADGIDLQQSSSAFDISNAEFYSGAADGADKAWGTAARALGISVKDYTGNEYRILSQEWKDKIEKEYTEARQFLGKPAIPIKNADSNMDPGILTRRDMMQADKADAVFAVIEGITKPREVEDYKGNKYSNNTGHDNVKGGTANAVARGIIRGIPVYVFDQSDNQWKVWDNNSKSFIPTPEPTLTSHAATVGTRGINDAGRQAIKSILAKTVSQKPTSSSPSSEATQKKVPQLKSGLKVRDDKIIRFNQTFTPQQIKDRGAMISDLFSDIIDDSISDRIKSNQEIIDSDSATEQEKREAAHRINELLDPVNGRQMVAMEVGIGNIVNRIKDIINAQIDFAERYNQEDKKIKLQNTLEYFEELFNSQASLDIEEREGIRIINLQTAGSTAAEEEAEEEATNEDNVATGSDGWIYKARYENPFDTLSKKVRRMLYQIDRPQNDVDDLGGRRYYPMGQIYASLLSYLSKHMQSPEDFIRVYKDFDSLSADEYFANRSYKDVESQEELDKFYPDGFPVFPVLEECKKMYSWTSQIIHRLEEDYLGKEWNHSIRFAPTGGALASQFYSNFRKPYIPYGKIQLEKNDNFGVTPLNYEMEDRVQYDKLVANYNNRMVLTDHSIYDSQGLVNKENAAWLQSNGEKLVRSMLATDYTTLVVNGEQEGLDFIQKALHIVQSFGIDATQDSIVAYLMMDENGEALRSIIEDLSDIARRITKVSDERVKDYNYILDTKRLGTQKAIWPHFFDGRGMITDASYMQSFYDSGSHKTKYSYSADNYLMKTFRGVVMGTPEERRAYIDEHFGKYEWFKNQKTGEWRNKWLEYWYDYKGTVDKVPYRNIDNISDADRDGNIIVRQYQKWTPDDIWQVQNRSYESRGHKSPTAFYLTPIFSDSPMSMTVVGPKLDMDKLFDGYVDNGQRRMGALPSLVCQELYRIKYMKQRRKAIEDGIIKPIANFDGKRGSSFCFIPELNDYRFNGGEFFLDRMKRLTTYSEIEENIKEALSDILDNKLAQYIVKNKEQERYQHGTIDELVDSNRDEYYNMVYANAAIIQMTTVDLAFYKDDTDFQKRFKEVYAGGTELNTGSRYGRKEEHVVLVADDIVTSPSYDKVAAVIDGSDNLSADDKERIKGTFTDINEADAQAIRSMHSFRSVLDMLGRWDDRMETALNNFKNGTWNMEDFNIVYQIIKPFSYSVTERNDGTGGSILVPQQHKNSEICALMMYDLITNGLNNSPVYRAFSRFMEENKGNDGEYLIDMIQFESAGKVGNQGVVSISFNPNKVVAVIDNGITVNGTDYEFYTDEVDGKFLPNDIESAEANYKAVKSQMDSKLQNGEMSQDSYNKIMDYLRPTEDEIVDMLEKATLLKSPDGRSKAINTEFVRTVPFDNYYEQQPTPGHYIDAEAAFGSQARNLSVADLPDDFEVTLKGWGTKSLKGRDAVIDFYYELLNENLLEDFFSKGGLKSVFSSKESLRDAVTEIVRGNPKYGKDFAEALKVDENTGEFILSPNSPTIFNLMQELVTSMFKNRITKQKINGAALIQAAGIGLDDDLRLRFDKDGKFLGAECYMPLTSKSFFEPFLDTKVVDGREIQVLNPKRLKEAGLDRAVGYRIPTENKSSMMPLIIKGFTPLQNGSAIVLPAEITNIAGSDFDVDKMCVMLPAFYTQRYDMRGARQDYAKVNKSIADTFAIFSNSQMAADMSESDPQPFKDWFKDNKEKYEYETPVIRRIDYDFSKEVSENSREARNNMVIQLIYNILTSKAGSEALFNPQGFPDVEHAAKVCRIIGNPTLIAKWVDMFGEDEGIKNLSKTDTKTLDRFIKDNTPPESPVYPQTFADSHARNMAGSIQIGIYALQASMAAKFQRANTVLKPNQIFTINGRDITDVDISENGKRVKNVGQMVGASADNGKKPNLTDMGSTTKSAPMIGYLLRAGLSHLEAALIINQPVMQEAIAKYGSAEVWGKSPQKLPMMNVTTEMLLRNIAYPDSLSQEEQDAIKAICYRVYAQNQAMEYINKVSRADSPNGSMQNSYAKARIQRYRVDLMRAKMAQRDFPFMYNDEMLSNTAIDDFSSESKVREQLKGKKLGLLQGFYNLGINSFNSLVSPYFFGARKWFDEDIVKPILYNLNEGMSDERKELIVNNIYTSYITYILSASPLFGNDENTTMKEKRDYYLGTFPTEYLKTLAENKDIADTLGSILQVIQDGSRKRIVLQDAGSMDKGQKADIQRRLDNLVYSPNPAARKLAEGLFMYSYYDNGLNFTHDSFSTMFSTSFLTNFPVFNETLSILDNEITDDQKENFIVQFLLTFPGAAFNANGVLNADNVINDGDNITIDLSNFKYWKGKSKMINDVMSPNPSSEGVNVYPYISYNDELYILDRDKFEDMPGTPFYNKVTKYATYPRLPLFNINMSAVALAEEFPYGEVIEQVAPEQGEQYDAPYAPSEPVVDPTIGISMEDISDIPSLDLGDISGISLQDIPDIYKGEGNSQLQSPFCK